MGNRPEQTLHKRRNTEGEIACERISTSFVNREMQIKTKVETITYLL